MAHVLSVKEWTRFQHYKDRDPPWIKLYRDTFTSTVWVLGTDLSRLLQLASTMLAARYSNRIPLNFELIRQVTSIKCDEADFMTAITHLLEHEFLEIHEVEEPRKQIAINLLATCTAAPQQSGTQRRGEESREEAEQRREELSVDSKQSTANASNGNGKHKHTPKPDKAVVARVFSHWQTVHEHPTSKLDDKRTKLIQGALELYSEADLCQSISGYKNSPHHMGQNDRDTRYDSIELMLRDAKHIDAGLKFYAEPPRTEMSAQTRRIVDSTADWVPPEMRR